MSEERELEILLATLEDRLQEQEIMWARGSFPDFKFDVRIRKSLMNRIESTLEALKSQMPFFDIEEKWYRCDESQRQFDAKMTASLNTTRELLNKPEFGI